MKTRYIISILCIAMFFISCSEKKKDTIEVKGTMKNIDKIMALYPEAFKSDSISLLLYEMPFGGDQQPVQIDSVIVSKQNPGLHSKGKGEWHRHLRRCCEQGADDTFGK